MSYAELNGMFDWMLSTGWSLDNGDHGDQSDAMRTVYAPPDSPFRRDLADCLLNGRPPLLRVKLYQFPRHTLRNTYFTAEAEIAGEAPCGPVRLMGYGIGGPEHLPPIIAGLRRAWQALAAP